MLSISFFTRRVYKEQEDGTKGIQSSNGVHNTQFTMATAVGRSSASPDEKTRQNFEHEYDLLTRDLQSPITTDWEHVARQLQRVCTHYYQESKRLEAERRTVQLKLDEASATVQRTQEDLQRTRRSIENYEQLPFKPSDADMQQLNATNNAIKAEIDKYSIAPPSGEYQTDPKAIMAAAKYSYMLGSTKDLTSAGRGPLGRHQSNVSEEDLGSLAYSREGKVLQMINRKFQLFEELIFVLKARLERFEELENVSSLITKYGTVDELIRRNEELEAETAKMRVRDQRFSASSILRGWTGVELEYNRDLAMVLLQSMQVELGNTWLVVDRYNLERNPTLKLLVRPPVELQVPRTFEIFDLISEFQESPNGAISESEREALTTAFDDEDRNSDLVDDTITEDGDAKEDYKEKYVALTKEVKRERREWVNVSQECAKVRQQLHATQNELKRIQQESSYRSRNIEHAGLAKAEGAKKDGKSSGTVAIRAGRGFGQGESSEMKVRRIKELKSLNDTLLEKLESFREDLEKKDLTINMQMKMFEELSTKKAEAESYVLSLTERYLKERVYTKGLQERLKKQHQGFWSMYAVAMSLLHGHLHTSVKVDDEKLGEEVTYLYRDLINKHIELSGAATRIQSFIRGSRQRLNVGVNGNGSNRSFGSFQSTNDVLSVAPAQKTLSSPKSETVGPNAVAIPSLHTGDSSSRGLATPTVPHPNAAWRQSRQSSVTISKNSNVPGSSSALYQRVSTDARVGTPARSQSSISEGARRQMGTLEIINSLYHVVVNVEKDTKRLLDHKYILKLVRKVFLKEFKPAIEKQLLEFKKELDTTVATLSSHVEGILVRSKVDRAVNTAPVGMRSRALQIGSTESSEQECQTDPVQINGQGSLSTLKKK